ncbi:hypothetical protein [Bradyrhizobium sp. LTSP885]|uniref:hypothetical protein n=1 Tax=Bradyrhizobium sp. LTSP885 TaxID=1619232 RepID=UPI0012E01AA4|nr:hypothetical protein [Bradyrhizobium sp. LTSP885]
MIYRVYVLTWTGDVIQSVDLDGEGDEEAISWAGELVGDNPVEVWLGPRRIARLTVKH